MSRCLNDCEFYAHSSIDYPRNIYEMNNETLVFQQNDLFITAFPVMEEIRREGKLCDVVLKVHFLIV